MLRKIPVITGPTAAGKTKLGVMLALELGGEIVSADSMQIYRGMDTGTAKPSEKDMMGIPHHMISVADPAENYSVARYVKEATQKTEDILSRGKIPFIVGGSGLYIDSLINGREFADAPKNDALRRSLSDMFDRAGGEAMLNKLRLADPAAASKLSAGDKKRIVRALEVYEITGRTITEHDLESASRPPRFDAVKIAVSYEDRKTLYSRIDERVDDMVAKGLFEEVQKLLPVISGPNTTAGQAIGYKEAASALRGEMTRAEATDLIKKESRRYAKRQLTWLRRDKNIYWILRGNERDLDFAFRTSLGILTNGTNG